MAVTDYRHFFVRDENNDKVGVFDIKSDRVRELTIESLPDDLSVQPIKIPDHAADHASALDNINQSAIDWDPRLE